MKDIVAGRKKAIKNTDVTHIYAPQYEALTIEKILAFVDNYTDIRSFLPDAKDIPALPRQVICRPNLKLNFFG